MVRNVGHKLRAVCYATHAGHHAQNVVRVGIDTDLGSGSASNSSG